MKWLRRLFGGKEEQEQEEEQKQEQEEVEENGASREKLASSIAQASSSLGDVTLMMLDKMEELLDKPLSAQECQSAEQSLDNLESTLNSGVVPPGKVKDALERIRKLREKLSQAKASPATNEDE